MIIDGIGIMIATSRATAVAAAGADITELCLLVVGSWWLVVGFVVRGLVVDLTNH
jgi:hypothetical protein